MTQARARTFQSIAEYKATYYPQGDDTTPTNGKAAAEVGKNIGSISLEVLREAIAENRDPSPRPVVIDKSKSHIATAMVRRQG